MKFHGWLVVGAVALTAGINLVDAVRRGPPPPRLPAVPATDPVVRHEARFAGVTAALRRHEVRGVVGYFCDLTPEVLAATPAAMEDYFLTQFALVPWVLDPRDRDRPWAIANLRQTGGGEPLPAGYRMTVNFGGGVLLLERTRP